MTTSRRPGGMALIAWIWLFTAVVTMLAGGVGLIWARSAARVSAELEGLLAGSWTREVSGFLLTHFAAVSVIHIVLALFKAATGLGLLRGWAAAVAMVVGLCWFSMVYDLLVGIHLIGVWWATAGVLFAEETPLLYQLAGTALLVTMVIALIVPLLMMIIYLRRLRQAEPV